MKPSETFLWHDYETFGAQPMYDRPAQFAAQRTDADLNPMGDPVCWYCAPADDVLPHPAACLITGILPQQALRQGVVETEFAGLILDVMMQPGTCSAGYNNIRFDDVFTRNLMYRNFRDPYAREYLNGNSRWDLIDLARMCYALRPDGIEWPVHAAEGPDREGSGAPSFRLEDLTRANGISHGSAHDALADVTATIELARLVKNRQPRLFEWALGLRDQKTAMSLLDPLNGQPVVHTSARIAAARGCTTLELPLAVLPNRPKSIVAFDLMADPGPLIAETAESIADLVFTPAADMPEGLERLPLKVIHSNHVPMLAPVATLRGIDTERIRLDPGRCYEHARQIQQAGLAVRNKVIDVFSRPFEDPEDAGGQDPDQMLYSGGFFSAGDKHAMRRILEMPPKDLAAHDWKFEDRRLPLMLFRYRARNYPDTLNPEERDAWDRDRSRRLITPADERQFSFGMFRAAVADLRRIHTADNRAQRILDQLESWVLETGLERLWQQQQTGHG